MDDISINDLVHDLRQDADRYEKKAVELEEDARLWRRKAERVRIAIEYVLKAKQHTAV